MIRLPVEKKACLSLLVNIAFALGMGVLGIIGRSWWHTALAAYYTVLSITRFAVILSFRRQEHGTVSEIFVRRVVGALFMFLAVVLAGTTYMAFSDSRGTQHHEIIMISIAVYAFWKLTMGAVNFVKSKRVNDPFWATLWNISLADGLVTIFSLQRSMLVSFEGMTPENIALFNALTGSGVYLCVFLMGLNLIGGKRITMAKSKFVEANEKIAKAVTTGYKKIETGVVGGYTKLEDKFIDQFLSREGETLEEARERLKGKTEE